MDTEHMAHFPEELSEDIQRYATDEVFKHSRYIFTKRQGKQQIGWCTHCKVEFRTNGFTHNKVVVCPECESKCTVKASGIGRKKMIDEAYFVYYEKSIKDPQVIIARGIYAARDYSGNYYSVQTLFVERTRYIFAMDKCLMFERPGYYSMAKTMKFGEFYLRKSVNSILGQYNADNKRFIATDYSRESIRHAVKDTPFSWSGWESYKHQDMVKFFALYARYPCVEYLTKLGFVDVVVAKLSGDNTYSAINWRGKTLFKILKLTKVDLNHIKAAKIPVDPLFLKIMQLSRKDGSNLSIADISVIRKSQIHLSDLLITLKYTTLKKAFNYITKQRDLPGEKYSEYMILIAWRDYIADCLMLEMDLADERILFPKNVHEAHQATTKRIKTHENEFLDLKIKRRLEDLNSKYYFEYSGLLIRPALSTKELIFEGKELGICVGNYGNGYMTKYAKGKTDLLLIRRISKPDKPYYTVELKNSTIMQVQGYKHSLPNDEVSEFIKAFKEQKLSKKTSSRVKITVPA